VREWFKKTPKSEPTSPENKRRAERFNKVEPTRVYGEEEARDVVLRDISLSGVRFFCPQPLEKNSVLNIRINYNPIDFPVRVLVAWQRPVEGGFDHGAEFINVPDDEMNLLVDHLDEIRPSLLKDSPPKS